MNRVITTSGSHGTSGLGGAVNWLNDRMSINDRTDHDQTPLRDGWDPQGDVPEYLDDQRLDVERP